MMINQLISPKRVPPKLMVRLACDICRHPLHVGVSQKMGVNRWFIMENLLKWMIWGYPYFRNPPCESSSLKRTVETARSAIQFESEIKHAVRLEHFVGFSISTKQLKISKSLHLGDAVPIVSGLYKHSSRAYIHFSHFRRLLR